MKTCLMNVKNNELYIGKYKMSDLVKMYNSPLYVFDEENIRTKLDIFKSHFKSEMYECKVIYASKAFFCPYIADIMHEYNMGLDSVSHGDLFMIKHALFDLKDVVLHGNNKTIEEINYAIDNNIGYIICDNFEEIKLIEENKKEVDILLRVNPGIEAHTHEYIQTSLLNSKFGESIFDDNKINEIVEFCKNAKYVKFKGFHCHIGSSINASSSFSDSAKAMLEFLHKTEVNTGYHFDVLNLGGGFGVKYLDSDKEIDLKSMLDTIIDTVNKYLVNNNMTLKKLMIEPGRSIVGDSGFTLYTAGITKETYGKKKYLFVDGGMTDNIRPALYQASYTVENASNMDGEKIKVDVVGPCCESGDIVAKDVFVQQAKPQDTIIAYSTGAYGYSMSSNYNGSVRGAVIFVNKDDKITLGLKREDFNDLCKSYPVVKKTHKIFDCHSDMLYDLWTKRTMGVNDAFSDYHVNQLENSVIHGALWTMYSEYDFDLIEACKIALKEIKMNKLSDFNVVLGLEGLRNLKNIEDLDILYNMGFRHAMVTWNEENKYATGAKSNPERGFTEEGYKLLKRMEELDMIIDLAHLNEKSFYDAINYVNKNIIYSHGLCKKYCSHVRNLTDEQMIALKKKDGLFGLTLANSFISDDKNNRTFEMFMKHVKHAIDIMGIDNVCFGFDFMDYLAGFPNSNLEDVKDATFAYRIIEGLESLGLSDEDIDKITYNNFYSRFKGKIVLKGEK